MTTNEPSSLYDLAVQEAALAGGGLVIDRKPLAGRKSAIALERDLRRVVLALLESRGNRVSLAIDSPDLGQIVLFIEIQAGHASVKIKAASDVRIIRGEIDEKRG